MAESLTPAPPVESSRQSEVYRPLSGFAVAALGLGILYALILACAAISSLLSRTPLFLSPWTLVLPASVAGMAFAARQHIRYAEGTRSGEGLVRAAFYLSSLGLVYLAIYVGLFMAVKLQAERFVNAWFQKVHNNQLMEAFLETRKPAERESDDPNDKAGMLRRYGGSVPTRPLLRFQDSDLVYMLQDPEVSIEQLGVRSLDYEPGGYKVRLSYRITTPEGMYDWVVTAQSSDTRKERRWMIFDGDTMLIEKQLTPLGESYKQMRDQAHRFAYQLADKRSRGDVLGLYVDTLGSEQRKAVMDQLRLLGAGSACLQVGLGTGGGLSLLGPQALLGRMERAALPGLDQFRQGSLLSSENLEAQDDIRQAVLGLVPLFCRDDADVKVRVVDQAPIKLSHVSGSAGQLRFEKDVEVALFEPGIAMGGPKITAEARLVMESTPDPASGPPRWRLTRIDLLREKMMPKAPARR